MSAKEKKDQERMAAFKGLLNTHDTSVGVWLHVLCYRARSGGKPFKIVRDYQFVDQEHAEACMEWYKKRGGTVELWTYRITKNWQHPHDVDMSDVCPCG